MSEPKLIDNDAKRDDDEGDDAPEVKEKPEQAKVETADSGEVVVRQTRKERHSERGFKMRLEAETRAKDEELARMRQELARLSGVTEQMQRQVQSQGQVAQPRQAHPLKATLNAIWSKQIAIQNQMETTTDAGRREELLDKWKDLELEGREEEARYYATRAQQQQQNQARNVPDPHVAAEDVILRSEYPKVWANQQALQFAAAYFTQLKVRAAHTGSGESMMALQRQALQHAAQTYGIDAPPAPSQGVQARYGAVSAQAGGTRTGAGEVRLSSDQQRLARAMYPSDSDTIAFAKWAALWQRNQNQE